ncbi:major allergen I polypeptide chain 2 [Lynx rufus]|uniref:major allergen I polypeptide chain 2 n=1 Tax=Lynx rufus TaxID=61384 RepID=UPI001F125EC3|nr:major allergen I polypeptide chain 2 [Lynx rufus]
MRGALLVLALLVTQELGVKMAETCPIFYDVFTAVASGSELLLDSSLTKVNATEPERTAMKKIQDCYVENGLVSTGLDALVMITISSSKDCIVEAVQNTVEDLKLNTLGR